jgi:M6 family metalloprotease-like protein
MLGKKHLIVFIICMAIAGGAVALVAPKDGGKVPAGLRELMEKNPEGFNVTRGWAQKVERIKRQRDAFIAVNGPQALSALTQEYAVSGTMEIPVMLCEFANRPGPFDSLAVQTKLFGPQAGTVTDYYDEVSYSLLNMTGTVYDWVPLSNNDDYYEGLPGCNGFCGSSHIGALLLEVLTAKDPQIDFTQYDNDGPDGVPNSGDDDGFVDFVAFVHSEYGGECGSNNNLWSHQYVYQGWPESGGLPFITDDTGFSGSPILISEYTMQPVRNCPPDNANMNEIGVFCHEFGHAFGLPDLYDSNGGSSGIGYWGIMGSGNWNISSSPAHPCAWTRMQLGWVTPTDVDWGGGSESIDAIATSGEVFRLGFTQNRFRRSDECVVNGSYSLYCGLHQGEGLARGWGTDANDRGYGNTWTETIQREFSYNGSGPVNFSYQYKHDTEAGFDYCYAIIEVQGTENVLDTFDGVGTGTANHNISSYLSGLPAGSTYKIKFRGASDPGWADEDGYYKSNCGMFVVDDVAVNGGGETYSADFETLVDGWYQSSADNQPREYWLVENRQVSGFDQHLEGTGLLITHIDEPIIEGPFLGNSGGDFPLDGDRDKGVAVEQADGLDNLGNGQGRGDAGDVYPGSSDNRSFDANSNPHSHSNAGATTQIAIGLISNSGSTMTAMMKAGDPGPTAVSSAPSPIDNNVTAQDVVITGQDFVPGATFYYNHGGVTASGPAMAPADGEDIVATSIRWIDSTRLEGTINVYSKTGGEWDLIVSNPDGQEFTLSEAITINQLVATQLQSATIDVDGDAIRLEYVLFDREPGEHMRLSRSQQTESFWRVIVDDLQPESDEVGRYVYVDDHVEPGEKYFYKLDVVEEDGKVRELHRGNAAVPAGEMKLAQNFPNPFNPTTTISFYLPVRMKVRLEVFDVSGRLVTRLGDGVYGAGPHQSGWNGTDANGTPVSSGVYVYRLTAGNRTMSKKMILLK